MSSPDATPPPALYTTLVFDPKTPPIAATEMTFPTMDTELITPTADTGMTLPTMDTELITPTADTGMTLPTMDIAIVAAVIAAVALVLLCLLLVMLRYLFRHKGTYHTNEAKGTEFAESADVALQSDPALQDAGDSGKKEYFI